MVDRATARRIVVDPGREETNRRVAERFGQMLDQGGLDEVRALLDLRLDPGLPAMRAIGVAEMKALLAGELSRAGAVEAAVTATRQYAKRQRTWFRNQFGPDWARISGASVDEVAKLA